jgi:hypothetical protein
MNSIARALGQKKLALSCFPVKLHNNSFHSCHGVLLLEKGWVMATYNHSGTLAFVNILTANISPLGNVTSKGRVAFIAQFV